MRKLVAVLLLAGLPALGFGATSVGAAQSCSTSKVAVTRLVSVKRDGRVVRHRVDVRQRVRVRVKGRYVWREEIRYRTVTTCPTFTAPAPNIVATTTAAPSVTSTASTSTQSPTPAPIVYSAVDPSYAQAAANPRDVTWTFSADAKSGSTDLGATGQLPAGILDLFDNGILEKSVNVGGSVAVGTWQNADDVAIGTSETVVTEYIPNGSTAVTATDQVTVPDYSTTTALGTPQQSYSAEACGTTLNPQTMGVWTVTLSSSTADQNGDGLATGDTTYSATATTSSTTYSGGLPGGVSTVVNGNTVTVSTACGATVYLPHASVSVSLQATWGPEPGYLASSTTPTAVALAS